MKTRRTPWPDWQIYLQNFYSRWTRLEYLPIYIINLPVVVFYLTFALRARHPLFFTATNPDVHTGGLFGTDKFRILKKIDSQYIPRTIEVQATQSFTSVVNLLHEAGLSRYPMIAKPSIGERGTGVSKLNSEKTLLDYHSKMNATYLIQEYVDWPEEYSVLFCREPEKNDGQILSLCHKMPLTVLGNGNSTLAELIQNKERARLQWSRLKVKFCQQLDQIPENGHEVILEVIGNHSRGSTFCNANHLIDASLEAAFNSLMAGNEDLCFIRFDLKCHSLERLKELRDFCVVEINGVGAEPAHVYDPDNTPASFYRDMYKHWNTIYTIAKANHDRGVSYMPWSEGVRAFRTYRKEVKKAAI